MKRKYFFIDVIIEIFKKKINLNNIKQIILLNKQVCSYLPTILTHPN